MVFSPVKGLEWGWLPIHQNQLDDVLRCVRHAFLNLNGETLQPGAQPHRIPGWIVKPLIVAVQPRQVLSQSGSDIIQLGS